MRLFSDSLLSTLTDSCKDTLNDDEDKQQNRRQNVRPGAGKLTVGFHDGRDRSVDQYAEEGTENIADTAGQQRTADNRRGDLPLRVELLRDRLGLLPRPVPLRGHEL